MSDRIRSLLQHKAFNREWLEDDLHRPQPTEPPYVPETDYEAMRMMHEQHQMSRRYGHALDGHSGLVHREQTSRRDMPTGMNKWIQKYGHSYIDLDQPK